jgi:hypothetical protein
MDIRIAIRPNATGGKTLFLNVNPISRKTDLDVITYGVAHFAQTIGVPAFDQNADVSPGDGVNYVTFTLGTGAVFTAYIADQAGE